MLFLCLSVFFKKYDCASGSNFRGEDCMKKCVHVYCWMCGFQHSTVHMNSTPGCIAEQGMSLQYVC